jgi:predicted metal-dependent TIM-barrel fold hydrolase
MFDARLQADGLDAADLKALWDFGVRGALLPAHPDFEAGPDGVLGHLRALVNAAPRLAAAGIQPFVALGVPPGRAPEQGLEALLEAIPRLYDRARVVAIGLVGLSGKVPPGDEEEALARQLELAQSLALPVLVSVPRTLSRTDRLRTLALLREGPVAPDRVLLDGLSLADWPEARSLGHFVRPTLRGGQDQDALVAQVQKHGPEKLILGSGAGGGAADLLAVSRAAARLEDAGLQPAVIRRVTRDNALGFFRIALP